MTPLAWTAALALFCLGVYRAGVRLRDARLELERRTKRPPVIVQPYVGAVPKPLSAKQLAALKDRQHRINAREIYRANKYN